MDQNHKNCSNESKLFILCMKYPIPAKNKCKYLFDIWYKCISNEYEINIK